VQAGSYFHHNILITNVPLQLATLKSTRQRFYIVPCLREIEGEKKTWREENKQYFRTMAGKRISRVDWVYERG
jgi:hypothetical protein